MEVLGYVERDGKKYPYTDKDANGYEIHYLNGQGKKWVGARECTEINNEPSVGTSGEGSYLTPQNEFEKALINECTNLAQTLIKKNRDYGDSFSKIYDEYGDFSTEIRLSDKLNRYKTLNKQDNLVKDESKDDTLGDIAGYSILTLATKRLSRVGE